MEDPKKKMEPAGLVGILSFVIGIVIVFAGKDNKTPVVSIVGFFVAFIGVAVASFMQSASRKKSSGFASGASKAVLSGSMQKYVPVLADERTKQDPEVQRLLQYTSVQKAFFDPAYLGTAEAQNDPNVRELLGVLDNIILEQTAGGAYPPSAQGGVNDVSNLERERMQDEIERRKKEKNKPRRIAGFIMTIAGFALFMSPFFAGSRASDFFGLAPVGMALIVVGSVLCKQ